MTNKEPKVYPAGRYWVGDLCYVKTINWKNFCDAISDGPTSLDGDFVVDGVETWHHHTAYGDGEYQSNMDAEFTVDSGLIGIVKAEYASEVEPWLGVFISIDTPFVPTYDNGIFYIGPLEIYTDFGAEEGDDDLDWIREP